MKEKLLVATVLVLGLSGVCVMGTNDGKPRVDASSPEAMRTSMSKLRENLSPEQQKQLEQAMMKLAIAEMRASTPGQFNLLTALTALSKDPQELFARIATRLDGLTADEIVAAGATEAAVTTQLAAPSHGPGSLQASFKELFARARIDANHEAAVATLNNFVAAQAQCRETACIDADGDGAGEFGYLAELAGTTSLRTGAAALHPAFMSAAFGQIENGRLVRSAYCFQLYLPDANGQGTAEAAKGGGQGVAIATDGAESAWCCYAWPWTHGASGQRAYFVNQDGEVYYCENETRAYSGNDRAPTFSAAFRRGDTTLRKGTPVGGEGNDGETWRRLP